MYFECSFTFKGVLINCNSSYFPSQALVEGTLLGGISGAQRFLVPNCDGGNPGGLPTMVERGWWILIWP